MSGLGRYEQRGVSSGKEDVHKAIAGLDKGLYPKAFCKVLPDFITGSQEHGIIMHADGAGTKSSLAYAYWRETGDISVWHGIAHDSVIMNIDDLACAGVTDGMVLTTTIGRNKRLIDGEVVKALIEGVEMTLEMLRSHGIGIHSAGGETADIGDLVRTVVVDNAVTARLRRDQVVDNGGIGPGNWIVGLSSFGMANYETRYNAGIGSNGLTSARHDVFAKEVGVKYPETYDPGTTSDLVYCGQQRLTDPFFSHNINWGQAVLSPTRTYAPIVKVLLESLGGDVTGLIHCSGGGQTKVLGFIDGLRVIKNNLFPTPPLFEEIQRMSGTEWKEMYKVFNMGHRLEVYTVNKTVADTVIHAAEGFGVEAKVVGRVEAFPGGREVVVRSEHGDFTYQ